jgi:hypothetical protein
MFYICNYSKIPVLLQYSSIWWCEEREVKEISTFKCKTAYSMAAPAPEYLVCEIIKVGQTFVSQLKHQNRKDNFDNKKWIKNE